MPIPIGFELEEEIKIIPKTPEGFELEPISKVPEGFELEVERRELPTPNLPQYLKFKLNADRAHSERSKYGREAMWGKIDTQKALEEGNKARDYWMTQAGPYEDLSFKRHPFKYVAGETAQLIPYMLSSQTEGLKYGLILGGGFAAIAGAAGQAGPQILFPEEVFTVPASFAAGMSTGYGYGVIKNMIDREGGSLYLDMTEKGISPETARPLALGAGTVIGIIEGMQFKLLGKPFKQAFSKIIKTKVGKAAITQAIGRYAKSVGIQVAQEDLQEITGIVTETIAGQIEQRPDAIPTKEEWVNRLYETTVRSLAGMAVISAPGAAVDTVTSLRTERIVKKQEDVNLLNQIITELQNKSKLTDDESKLHDKAISKLATNKPLSVEEQAVIEKVSAMKEEAQAEPTAPQSTEGKVEVKAKITPEQIKPDISGITPLQKQIQAMEERQGRVEILDNSIKEIDNILEFYQYSLEENPETIIEDFNETFGTSFKGDSDINEYVHTLENTRKSLLERMKIEAPQKITKRETTLLTDKIKAVEMGMREGKIQTKAEIKNVQTEIIEMIEQSGLEADDRAKFMRLIKNIQTQTQFKGIIPEIIDRLQTLRDKAERTEIITDLRNLFEKQPTQNLPIEYKDLIEDIKSKFLLKKRTEKAKARLESMRQFVERMAEQGEEINIPEEKLALLEKKSTDEMTTQELRDLQETIQRLYHQGKLKNKLLTVLQERNFDSIKEEIVNTITQGKGLNEDSSIVKALREQNKNLKDKSLDVIKNYIIENMRPELMLNILDGGAPGIISNTLFNSLWEAQKAELQESQKTSDTIKDIHKNLNFVELFTKKYNIGRFKGMTKDQALFIYANSFNDSNRAHLTGSGITDEDISAIETFLSTEEKQAVKDIIRYYDEYQYPLLDRLFVELEGVHLGKEDQYFPIDRVENVSYNKELEKDILERNYIRRPGVSKGFTKERVSSTKGFSEFSYFGTILRNHRKVEHYKAFAKAIRDANKILNNLEIKATIKQQAGDKYFSVLDKWLKDVAYGMDKKSMDTTEKLIQWLRTNYAVAVIGGNLLSVMKAPISFLQGMEMAGKWNTTKALSKFILAPLDWNAEISKKSILMQFRAMRQERELGEIVSQRTLKQQIDKVTGMQLIREKSMLPWVIADKATCDIIWLAAYEGAKADNMGEQAAINHADMVIRRTQPMSGALNLPDTFRGREYQKLFTLFRNQPNQNFNLLLESVLKKQKGKISNTKFLSNQVFYLIVPAMILGIINRKRLPEDLGEFAKDILNGALGGLIYIGNITNMIASGFMGATTPIESMFEDVYNFYRTKAAWSKLDKLVSLVSKLVGVPYLAVKRIIKGEPFGKPPKITKKGLRPI